jgi:predicted nucleic acid-binding Zn ribbon protein
MTCPRCRAENLPSHRFCVACGQALQASCVRCGFVHEPGARFCGGCGQPILVAGPARFASPETYTPPHLAEKIRTSRGALEASASRSRCCSRT